MKHLHTHVTIFLANYQIHCILNIAIVTVVKARREMKQTYFAIKIYSVIYKKLKQYA